MDETSESFAFYLRQHITFILSSYLVEQTHPLLRSIRCDPIHLINLIQNWRRIISEGQYFVRVNNDESS